jgi:hypothetical protein
MRRASIFAVLGFVLSTACATSRAIEFSNVLAINEEHADVMLRDYLVDVGGDSHAAYLERLENYLKRRNLPVVVQPGLSGDQFDFDARKLLGYNAGDRVYLNAELSINGRFATLVHELGHTMQPKALNGSENGQVFAETLAYLVCKAVGLDTWQSSALYLQQFDDRHRVVVRYSREIDAAVETILKEIQ